LNTDGTTNNVKTMTTTDIGKIFPTIATVDEVEYITAPSTDD